MGTKQYDSATDLITFSRASSATFLGSNGLLQTAANDVPRIEYDATGAVKGLLIEEVRTNLLLNSGTLATQSVTVSATGNTLSFTGTGTVTLSGVSTAGPLVGTGTGENNRVNLTFTPTAGTLTLTVSGTVTNAQLEAGAFPTSYIPTTGATATRAMDLAEIPTSAFGYNNDAGSIAVEFKSNKPSSLDYGAFVLSDGAPYNRIVHSVITGTHRAASVNSGNADVNMAVGMNAPYELVKFAIGFSDNNFAASVNGATAVTDTSVTIPSGLSKLALGYFYPTNPNSSLINGHIKSIQYYLNGHIEVIEYYDERLTSAFLQVLSSQAGRNSIIGSVFRDNII